MAKAIKINDKDNVAVCVGPIKKGELINCGGVNDRIVAVMDIEAGHKIAIRSIKKGSYVIKYGEVIGVAVKDISKGAHVHLHNMISTRFKER